MPNEIRDYSLDGAEQEETEQKLKQDLNFTDFPLCYSMQLVNYFKNEVEKRKGITQLIIKADRSQVCSLSLV